MISLVSQRYRAPAYVVYSAMIAPGVTTIPQNTAGASANILRAVSKSPGVHKNIATMTAHRNMKRTTTDSIRVVVRWSAMKWKTFSISVSP